MIEGKDKSLFQRKDIRVEEKIIYVFLYKTYFYLAVFRWVFVR